MRIDKPEAQNTFNIILIAFFFLGSSNLLFIIFFRPSPIKYGTELTDIITKYEMCYDKYKIVNGKTLEKIPIEELLAVSYLQKESLKNFRISEKRGENAIKMDPRFQTDNVYDHKKFILHLDNMRMALKVTIKQKDYLVYKQVSLAKELMEKVCAHSLLQMPLGALLSKSISTNTLEEVMVVGYRIPIAPMEEQKYNFSKKEIQDFIKEQIRQKIGFYIVGANVSGFIIKLPMNMSVNNIIGAVNFFLKQEKFNEVELQSFMEQYYIQSQDFTKTLDYKTVLDQWKKNGKKSEKSVDISSFFQIEVLDKVEETEDNKFVFDNQTPYHKDFYPIGTTYYRVIVKEHKKEELKKITDKDIREYVIPTMVVIAKKNHQLAMAYKMQFQHNNGENIISTANRKIIVLNLPLYLFLDRKNKAVVMYDVYDIPYLFIVEKVQVKYTSSFINKDELGKYMDTLFKKFMLEHLYIMLFQIYYDKFKNPFKA